MIRTMKFSLATSLLAATLITIGLTKNVSAAEQPRVHYKTEKVGDVEIFYREAGPKDAPTILLLHGFPTSSQMFRNLIPALADKYHVVAPDYPGYGHSSMPMHDQFQYTFDNIANIIDKFTEQIGISKFAIYVQDYGAPVGYRIALKHPERITAIVVQNGNAYDEGLDNDFWKPIKAYWKEPNSLERRNAIRNLITYDATKWQYTDGAKDVSLVSPDGASHDQFLLDRKGNDDIQLDLFLSYGSNPPLYPSWQAYFRKHQPPMLIVWGKNDKIFPPAGAEPYKRDLKKLEFHLIDAGHFALETNGNEIAELMRDFLERHMSEHSHATSTKSASVETKGFNPAPFLPLATQQPARLIVDQPLPDPLAKGYVVVRYRAENVRILPVYGADALKILPRIGHLHVTIDDLPWHWLDSSGEPISVNGLSPGHHKLLIELESPTHKVIDSKVIEFEIPKRD